MRWTHRSPGDWLLHPVALVAALLLGLNDHVLKQAFPGVVTGKLSDFAGMVLFPLFLLAVSDWCAWLARRRPLDPGRMLPACTLVTGVAFAAINISHSAGRVYARCVETIWATLGWSAFRVHHTVDPSDLLALGFLLVPALVVTADPQGGVELPGYRADPLS